MHEEHKDIVTNYAYVQCTSDRQIYQLIHYYYISLFVSVTQIVPRGCFTISDRYRNWMFRCDDKLIVIAYQIINQILTDQSDHLGLVVCDIQNYFLG